jgi:hypothetical protein
MISRTTIGSSFGGLVGYQFEGRKDSPTDKRAEILTAVGVRSDSAIHMSCDFNRGRQVNPNLRKAVWHTSLSFNPDDAVKLDSAKMLAIAEGYVRKMGLDKTQYAIIRHHDQPDNQHLHIIANRVGDDGRTIKDGHNFYHSKQVLKELMQEHGLTPPQGVRMEKQHPEKLHGAELTRHELKQALHQALTKATNRPVLLATLQAQKINAHEFTNKAGMVTGISFEKDGQVFKGSAVAREYSLAGLDQQLAANQFREQAEQACQAEAQEAAAQKQRQVAAELAAQRQETERQAARLAQRREAERQAARAAEVLELPAIARKWQAAYPNYLAKIVRENASIQEFNKLIDSSSEYLKFHPNKEGIVAVMRELQGDPRTAKLHADLVRQVEALAYHTRNWEITYGQQTALEKQASGPFWVSRVVAEAAAEKVKYLLDPAPARHITTGTA